MLLTSLCNFDGWWRFRGNSQIALGVGSSMVIYRIRIKDGRFKCELLLKKIPA
jgi:hypothetical protein